MVKPSKMDNNANYHLFKKDIKPMWEDPANMRGGKWILSVKGGDKSVLDQYWENLVLALVGETLDTNDDITGAVVSRRKAGDRCAIWTKNRDDEASIMTIGKRIRSLVGIPNNIPLSYQSHEDSLRTGASYTNPNKYTI
jgi:translation initiation factor 4E